MIVLRGVIPHPMDVGKTKKRLRAGPNLRAVLSESGITHAEIATSYGCTRAFVTGVLTGKEACPPALLETMARLIGERRAGNVGKDAPCSR